MHAQDCLLTHSDADLTAMIALLLCLGRACTRQEADIIARSEWAAEQYPQARFPSISLHMVRIFGAK
jgi:hypothetical protein